MSEASVPHPRQRYVVGYRRPDMALPIGQIPGGPELLIVLLVLLLLFGGSAVAVIAILGGVKLLRGDDREDDRLAAVERELEETRAELRELREETGVAGSGTADGDTDGGSAGRSADDAVGGSAGEAGHDDAN